MSPDDPDMTPIGKVGRALGLSARALRFYDEEGLVVAVRDRLDRRVYSPEACAELEIVSRLRSAGVPVEEVRWVLQAARRKGRAALVHTATDCLTHRLNRLAAEQRQADQVLDWVRSQGAEAADGAGLTTPCGRAPASLRELCDGAQP
jgi:DNA-binding transcriptional MerR regulator